MYPDGFCRFYPSCSEYAAQAIEKNGIIVGVGLGGWRIMRCNPWARGGYDPVPKLHSGTENPKHEIRSTKQKLKSKCPKL